MDVQTEKIELAKRLLETDDEELLQQIKVVFENHHVEENLPEHVKDGIQRSLKQASEGLLTSNDEVMKKYAKYL
jgi:uncharacterized protein with von Willebrand factor type A (vWA) domain